MMNAMWMWTAIAAAAVVMCTATGTVVVLVRRFTDRARKRLTAAKGLVKPRTAAAKRAKRAARFNLTRELHTAVAKRLPPQVLFQVIVDRLDRSRLPQVKARKERLVQSLANAEHMLYHLRSAAVALDAEDQKLATFRRQLVKQGHDHVSVATQTPFHVQPPTVPPRRRVRFDLNYAMPATDFKHITVRRFVKRLEEYTSYFKQFKTIIMVIVSFLERPNVLRKVVITVVNWASILMRITTKVSREENITSMEFELFPRRDNTNQGRN